MRLSTATVDDIQGYLVNGVALHPVVEAVFLEALYKREQVHRDVCLLPSSRLQLFHIRLYKKMQRKLTPQRRGVA